MKKQTELWIWSAGLLYLALVPPGSFSLCLLKHLGIYCPGCGLGHSIYYLVHGQWSQSWHHHPLGAFALLILLHRIYKLASTLNFKKIKAI